MELQGPFHAKDGPTKSYSFLENPGISTGEKREALARQLLGELIFLTIAAVILNVALAAALGIAGIGLYGLTPFAFYPLDAAVIVLLLVSLNKYRNQMAYVDTFEPVAVKTKA